MAADMWSLGVLTACMLTGHSIIPRDEMSQLSQKEISERFLGLDYYTRHKWQNLTPRALRFLRGLLSLQPDQRFTATQALHQSWFKKPLSEATLLEDRYLQVIKFWRPRSLDEVIEHLPSRTKLLPAEPPIKSKPGPRQNIPDTSNSPYFSLDRHLREKLPSQRMAILEKANQSKSFFVASDQPLQKKKRRHHPLKQSMIEDVSARDMIRKTPFEFDDLETEDEDVRTIELATDSGPARSKGGTDPKKRRVESEDLATKRLHSEISKKLSGFTNAKVLKDVLLKRKEQLGR
jgi:serine/threonine protein kinase